MNLRAESRRRHVLRTHVLPAVLLAAGAVLVLTAALALAPTGAQPVGAHLDEISVATAEVEGAWDVPSQRQAGPLLEGDRDRVTEAAPEGPEDTLVPRPVEVEIPRFELRADLIELGLDAERQLEVPQDPDAPGWYVGSARPGQPGAAVIAGHVDSHRGPAVFWHLPELEPGDEVRIHREDGSDVSFIVDEVGRWPKRDFPTDRVYRQADGAELRLITCGGVYDDAARSYRDNIVVFASTA